LQREYSNHTFTNRLEQCKTGAFYNDNVTILYELIYFYYNVCTQYSVKTFIYYISRES